MEEVIEKLLDYKQGWDHPWLAPIPIPAVRTNANAEDKDKNTLPGLKRCALSKRMCLSSTYHAYITTLMYSSSQTLRAIYRAPRVTGALAMRMIKYMPYL